MSIVSLSLLACLGLLLIAAAVGDLRERIIPNRLNAIVAILAVGWWLAQGWSVTAILCQLAFALLVFGVFAGCFALGWMGGGDVKLIGAIALWLPPLVLTRMLVWMVLIGGLLSVVVLIHSRWKKSEGAPEVPYGVAIAAAALMVVSTIS